MSRLVVSLALVGLLAACSAPEPPAPAVPAIEKERAAVEVQAKVRAVDPSGAPLAGMLPIATLQANAFDTPVAQGAATGTDGTSTILLDSSRRLFVRIWDPDLKHFAVNYFEVPPGEAAATEDMDVIMLPAGLLCASLVDPEGHPVAGADADIMLLHPELGPWWPARAKTDANGAVVFSPVPAGDYEVEIRVEAAGLAAHSKVFVSPGSAVDMGGVGMD